MCVCSLFAVGFAFLPFIWAVNSIWFFDEAFRKPAYDEQKSIRRCKYKDSCELNFVFFFSSSFVDDVLRIEVNASAKQISITMRPNRRTKFSFIISVYFRCDIFHNRCIALGHRSCCLDHNLSNESCGMG